MVAMDVSGLVNPTTPQVAAERPRPRWAIVVLTAVTVVSVGVGGYALMRGRLPLMLMMTVVMQFALANLFILRQRGDQRPPTRPLRGRSAAALSTRVDSWMLVEALADMAREVPAVPASTADAHTVVSRRNHAPVESFGTRAEAEAAVLSVVRGWPQYEGRFVVVPAGGERTGSSTTAALAA